MSLAGTFSSALSGLTVASRSVEVISTNIANALNEGYVRRELQLGSRQIGDQAYGVRVTGIARDVDEILLRDLRLARSQAAGQQEQTDFLAQLQHALGGESSTAGIAERIAAFDSALIAATASPDSEARLATVADAANALIRSIRAGSDWIQNARRDADAAIAADVKTVNDAVAAIARLNGDIVSVLGSGRDTSALQDQRQQIIDRLATIIPVREVQDDYGRVSLYTAGGAILLDGRATVLEFTPVGIVTPDMTQTSGALSGLTLKGNALRTDAAGPLSGGRLGASFAIRDQLAVDAQAMLDSLARDLVSRFQDPAIDATRAPGSPGLFTDAGAVFDPADELGLAQRLRLSELVDPAAGGELWRLRTGLGAAIPGAAGDGALLADLQTALTDPRMTASGLFAPVRRDLGNLASAILSSLAGDRMMIEAEASFSSARASALDAMQREDGVDTDREMQDLLLVEQAYAANAKVIQAADNMIQTLLEL
ncbi:MAG: flagellar hook-associated protein FlgK [Pseudorhodobacter sp.]